MKRAGKVVCRVFSFCSERVRPGVTTLEVDQRVESLIAGCAAFFSVGMLDGFETNNNASVSEEALHGLPRDHVQVAITKRGSVASTRSSAV